MKTYRIEKTATSEDMGTYEAGSAIDALNAMARKSGYDSYYDAQYAIPDSLTVSQIGNGSGRIV